MPQLEALCQLVELRRFGESDGDLGVDFPPALALDVLLPDGLDARVVVLGEDLRELEGEGDAFAHGFELHGAVLLEDQLGEEDALVDPRAAPDAVDVVLVELVGLLLLHQLDLIITTTTRPQIEKG